MKIFNFGSTSITRMVTKAVKSKDRGKICDAMATIREKIKNVTSQRKGVSEGAKLYERFRNSPNRSYESQKAMNRNGADFRENQDLISKERKYTALLDNLLTINSKSMADVAAKMGITVDTDTGKAYDKQNGNKLHAGFEKTVRFAEEPTTYYYEPD